MPSQHLGRGERILGLRAIRLEQRPVSVALGARVGYGRQIVHLSGILLQVEEHLRVPPLRKSHVFIALGAQHAALHFQIIGIRVELRDYKRSTCLLRVFDQRSQTDAGDRGKVDAGPVAEGGQDVQPGNQVLVVDNPARNLARPAKGERHSNRFFVQR